jgi:KDO2-lipid IV(A) lauroyltransferase
MFYLFYIFVWVITYLPLRVLYVLSDLAYLIVYYVIRYRRKVVWDNLSNSFPQKTPQEILLIERKFYRNFCDVFIETLYVTHCSNEEIMRRMKVLNIDLAIRDYDNGKSPMLMTAHYGNWEWASSASLWLPKDKPVYSVYKKLSNTNFNQFMCDLRKKFSGQILEKNDLLRKMITLKQDGQVAMFGMIADQTPTRVNIHYWTRFLNQDTPVLTGTEVLARKFDYPVYFGKITRIKRGYYVSELIPIATSPKLTQDFEITEAYIRLLEQQILEAPEYWLWTHKRWKHKKLN